MTTQPPLPGLLDPIEPLHALLASAGAGIVHEPLAHGGYALRVGTRQRVRVEPATEGTGWRVRNLDAGIVSGSFGQRTAADRMAVRIARLVAP